MFVCPRWNTFLVKSICVAFRIKNCSVTPEKVSRIIKYERWPVARNKAEKGERERNLSND